MEWNRKLAERFLRQIEASLVLCDPPHIGRLLGTVDQICREFGSTVTYTPTTAIHAPIAAVINDQRTLNLLETKYNAVYIADVLKLRQDELFDNSNVGDVMVKGICRSIQNFLNSYGVRLDQYALFKYPVVKV